MTPTTSAQKMRDYLRDRFAGCEDRENDSDSGTPHPDRETLENLSLAVELLDGLVACWYADEIEGAHLLAETAARRLFGWVECNTCRQLFPADDLTDGLCTDCTDEAEADSDAEPAKCDGCNRTPAFPTTDHRYTLCLRCADQLAEERARPQFPYRDTDNPFGGALDR